MFHHSSSASHTIYRAATHLNTTSQHHNTTSTFRSFDDNGVVGGYVSLWWCGHKFIRGVIKYK